jgi:hypothetical protein
MHDHSLHDERPDIRPFHSSSLSFPLMAIAAGVIAAAVYAYYALYSSITPPHIQTPTLAAAPAPAAPEPSPAAVSTAPDAPPMASLPSLDNSDALIRERLVDLMGRVPFSELVLPVALVRRIVATVDNLPRETAPRRVIPLAPVPGGFSVRGDNDRVVLDAGNFARYAPYVRVLEAIDEKALVMDYARAYPLFQQAYEELGYPGQQFNDRLIQAIDDLIATPELDAPIELVRPRVHYEFASPDLETRSAGQKILLRMGPENAARVKAKLLLVRREILAASKPR